MADKVNLDVTLFSCDYQASVASNLLLHPESLKQAIEHIKSQLKQKLQDLSAQYAHPNIRYTVRTEWHKPHYEATLKLADEIQPDLVLKEAKEHSIWQQLFFTPDDYQLLKASSTPLLLSKNQSWTNAQCVLAAVDPSHPLSQESDLDDIIIQQASELATILGLPLKIAHVFDPTGWEVVMNTSATAGVMGQFIVIDNPDDHQQLLQKIKERHQQQLDQLGQRHQIEQQDLLLLEGFPEEVLEQAANDLNAALIVVGTTYRTGLLGSTAEKLLEHISCDLVAVKPKKFAALKTH
jgi:universal stress protein E